MSPEVGDALHADIHLLAVQGAMNPYMIVQAEDETREAPVEC